jgi:hypothetical protein
VPDVIELLEAYGEEAEETVRPVELDEIVRPVDLGEVFERSPSPVRIRPRWVAAAAAAVVVVALIGGIGLLVQLSAGNEPPTITQPPAPTTTLAASTTTITTAATASPGPSVPYFSWVRLKDVFDGVGEGQVSGIFVTDDGLFAVGSQTGGDPAVWISANALEWTRIPGEAGAFAGPGDKNINKVIRAGDRRIAVGSVCPEDEEVCHAAVWVSEGEQPWARLPHDPVFEADGWFGMSDVVSWDGGLLAVGDSVWTSTDGLTWQQIPEPIAASASMWRATEFAGGIVAVGTDWRGGAVEGAIWMSVAGESWTRAPGGDDIFPTEANLGVSMVADVVATPDGLVAVGTVGTQDTGGTSAAWISTDGLNWDRVSVRTRARLEELWSVDESDGVFMAVGSQRDRMDEDLGSAQVFVSDDGGHSWSRLPDDPLFGNYYSGDTFIADVVGHEGKFIAVGSVGDASAVWIGTPES